MRFRKLISIAILATAGELWTAAAAPETNKNLLSARWLIYKASKTTEIRRGIICCENRGNPESAFSGVYQKITLNQKIAAPIEFSAESKCENVVGGSNKDYAVYLDIVHTDGSRSHGAAALFNPGTHDWEKAENVFVPSKPIKSLYYYLLFRNRTGKVWFRNASLAEVVHTLPPVTADGGKQKWGDNLIVCPGFEWTGELSLARAWNSRGKVFFDDREKHSGGRSLRCVVTEKGEVSRVRQEIYLNQSRSVPLLVEGWSRAEGVSDDKACNYCIYIDYLYQNGKWQYQLGEPSPCISFGAGTHDWKYGKTVIRPTMPIKKIAIVPLLRGNHIGTVWYDDIALKELDDGGKKTSASCESGRRRLKDLRDKVTVLKGEAAGLTRGTAETAYVTASLAVLDIYCQLLVADIQRRSVQYRKLSDCELKQLAAIAEKLAERIRKGKSGNTRKGKMRTAGLSGKVIVKNGGLYRDGIPVFLNGIIDTELLRCSDEKYDFYHRLGCSLLGTFYTNSLGFKGWNNYDDKFFETAYCANYRKAEQEKFSMVTEIHSESAPAWFFKLYPDARTRDSKWFRNYIDIDHPAAEKYMKTLCGNIAAGVKKQKSNFCYILMG
ncbi:MAG: hypothetical protein PHV82_10910, partial [Victivallaceae bacterium]|nr:hypothetical protein [Victivallaceae bacterium]